MGEITQKQSVIDVCDNCLTAASDECDPIRDLDRDMLEMVCINQGADILDHECLVTGGFQERCDCMCTKYKGSE